MANEGSEWLTQTPAEGEVRVHVALGDGAQLTPEVRDALEKLVQAIQAQQSDVQGYGGPSPTGQSPLGSRAAVDSFIKFAAPGSMTYKFQSSFLKFENKFQG